jgi:D-beta-D-heptose 7-phosphate kinase/D-beta-D-heptose 1-phosphate adenosyltransferase
MYNILIVGDIMIDHYVYVNINKIANESPIPVFNYTGEKYILGGCGNVYQNMKLFNNNIFLLSVVGQDTNYDIIKNITNDSKVHLITDTLRKTSVKHRIVADNKILFRYDNESTNSVNKLVSEMILSEFDKLFPDIDIVVFSDYNKGVLNEDTCQYIINKCNDNNKITIVDPKNNFLKYKNITCIKPNYLESSNYSKLSNINDIHKYIYSTINCKYSIVTLGKDGISLFDGKELFTTVYESNEVIDVTGAGDIITSVIASLFKKLDIQNVLKIATFLGTTSVKKIGTYELSHSDILSAYGSTKDKMFTDDIIYHLKKSNNKIVFTNGCFDILHIGHIKYLDEARKLGDILIVGINTDESIKRNKGQNRPINSLEDRVRFLSKFDFVDFIIPFDTDTPLEIIKKIEPDFLVKGGDYNPEIVVGKEYAKKTLCLSYTEGKSSSKIIELLSKE